MGELRLVLGPTANRLECHYRSDRSICSSDEEKEAEGWMGWAGDDGNGEKDDDQSRWGRRGQL